MLFSSEEHFVKSGRRIFDEEIVPMVRKLNTVIAGHKFAASDEVTYIDFQLYEFTMWVKKFDEELFK